MIIMKCVLISIKKKKDNNQNSRIQHHLLNNCIMLLFGVMTHQIQQQLLSFEQHKANVKQYTVAKWYVVHVFFLKRVRDHGHEIRKST